MNQVTLKVQGMSCQHCVKSVEGALSHIGAKGTVNLAQASVQVEYDETLTNLDVIKQSIEDSGYTVI
jgi:copper chaperone